MQNIEQHRFYFSENKIQFGVFRVVTPFYVDFGKVIL